MSGKNKQGMVARFIRQGAIGLAMVGILGAAGIAMAKGPGHHGEVAQMSEAERAEHFGRKLDKRMQKLTEALELSEAQAGQVRQIFEEMHAERVALHGKRARGESVDRSEFKALREQTRAKLEGVLSADQLAEFEAIVKKKHAKKRHRKAQRKLERMTERLNLTPEQVEQIKAIKKASHQEAKQIVELAGSREDAKPELTLLREQTREDIEGVLTPEQVKEFEAMRAERKERRGAKGK